VSPPMDLRGMPNLRPGEDWRHYARRMSENYSARKIARKLGVNHVRVLCVINPEYRRDRIMAERARRARMTPEERKLETLARKFRKGKRGWGCEPIGGKYEKCKMVRDQCRGTAPFAEL
jgi:hypothetical protein